MTRKRSIDTDRLAISHVTRLRGRTFRLTVGPSRPPEDSIDIETTVALVLDAPAEEIDTRQAPGGNVTVECYFPRAALLSLARALVESEGEE